MSRCNVHRSRVASDLLNPHASGMMSASGYWKFTLKCKLLNEFPGNQRIDLKRSSLEGCSLINGNWCISLDIVLIFALTQ